MSDLLKVEWTGKSGKKYSYFVYSIYDNFAKDTWGNYIIAKKQYDIWVPLFISHGDLSARFTNFMTLQDVMRRGATHIHAHLTDFDRKRREEVKDLLAIFPEAFEPKGFNKKL